MTLISKLNTISKPRMNRLQDGEVQTIDEFWEQFIEPNLPEKEIVLQWNRVLIEYVKRIDAMYAVRGYNTAPKDNYDSLRRGFLTKTSEQYSYFFTDNFHAAYYMKMARDGYVADVDEMIEVYNTRQFPARFGRDTENERVMIALPKGKDPGIQRNGYKIAHVINVGKDYYWEGECYSLTDIMKKYLPRGERGDWKKSKDSNGEYYVREFDVKPEARKFVVAEFLRFVHPFNYFLTPKKNCSFSAVCKDIAEYQPVIDYVRNKYAYIYGKEYQEFLDLIMIDKRTVISEETKKDINLKYSLTLKKDDKLQNVRKNKNSLLDKQSKENANNQMMSEVMVIKNSSLEEAYYYMIKEYLYNPKASFRELERRYMGIDSQSRGGGFQAKSILNSYGVIAKNKGVLSDKMIEQEIEEASGIYKDTLIKVKRVFGL